MRCWILLDLPDFRCDSRRNSVCTCHRVETSNSLRSKLIFHFLSLTTISTKMTTPTKLFMSTGLLAVLVAVALPTTSGFNIGARFITRSLVTPQRNTWPSTPCGRGAAPLSAEEWSGEVASNTEDGKIRGCMINPEGETSFTIRLDG